MAEQSVETVTWINVVPLNRRERIAKWWVDARQQQTYTSPRQRSAEFQSRISVDMIDQLACEGLRDALHRQRQERLENPVWSEFPRATPEGDQYFGSVMIPRRTLGVHFTSQGIVEDAPDENL